MENDRIRRILIIDDEKSLRLGTKRLLESEGYFVSIADNGTEGIAIGSSEEFDLALIDLKMPDIDGLQVLIKILQTHPNTVCIMMTGYASYETAIEAVKVGAFNYIPKPFTSEELLLQLKQAAYKRDILIETAKLEKEREERFLEVAFEKTRLNTIINSISDGLLVINKNGEVVLFNPSLLKYLELDSIKLEEKIVGKLHPAISKLVNVFLKTGIYEKKSFSAQVNLKPDNQLFVEATCSPVPHPDSSLAGVVVVIRDITGLKKIEFLKSQFVSMVSHELKAPLVAVYGYLKILSDPEVLISENQKMEFITRSQFRLDSLLKMINDLLDISKFEMKNVKRSIEELNVEEIIKSVLELFQLEIKKKNIKVELQSVDNPPPLKADKDEINRLLTNLISNAVKYNILNGSISVCLSYIEHYCIIQIDDKGIGMKPEEKSKLFQEFFRAKNERTKNISGTGLGMTIVKRIIDSYSGKIEVNTEYGIGTCFKIYLPIIDEYKFE